MTTTINASTSAGLIITPDTSGNIQLQYNGVAAPAFSAYYSGGTSNYSGATWTKIALNAEDFDTASCFDSTTNYRFTPNVAGYYLINAAVQCGSGTGEYYIDIAKNGSQFKVGTDVSATATWTTQVSAIVYANGSTDYFEIYATQSSGSSKNVSSGAVTYFQGIMIRGA